MKVNVLITGAAGNLAHFVRQALVASSLDLRIIACSHHHNAVGLFQADTGYVVPPAVHQDYLSRIVEICRREKVQIVMVCNMAEMRLLAQYRDLLQEETGAFVMAAGPEVLCKVEDKWGLTRYLKEAGFDCARSVIPSNSSEMQTFLEEVSFPCVVKDRFGSGSKGFAIAQNRKQFDYLIETIPNPVVQEYLYPDAEEYTVGVFVCRDGTAAASIVMKRELDLGLTVRAQVLPGSALGEYSERVAEKLGCLGPCNIQLRLTDRGPVVFEVNPRFSSTTSARPLFGYNEAEMAIRHFVLNEPITRPTIRGGRLFRVIEDVFIEEAALANLEAKQRIDNKNSGQEENPPTFLPVPLPSIEQVSMPMEASLKPL